MRITGKIFYALIQCCIIVKISYWLWRKPAFLSGTFKLKPMVQYNWEGFFAFRRERSSRRAYCNDSGEIKGFWYRAWRPSKTADLFDKYTKVCDVKKHLHVCPPKFYPSIFDKTLWLVWASLMVGCPQCWCSVGLSRFQRKIKNWNHFAKNLHVKCCRFVNEKCYHLPHWQISTYRCENKHFAVPVI